MSPWVLKSHWVVVADERISHWSNFDELSFHWLNLDELQFHWWDVVLAPRAGMVKQAEKDQSLEHPWRSNYLQMAVGRVVRAAGGLESRAEGR